ncbi:MAG: type II toxin-antitoxin system RelE/ParE family toxin [Thiotrichaceae bacterium]|nr:type II toxin-antitoxin system RelE/ParE family toxin [Thiotrichaceae bacterium]
MTAFVFTDKAVQDLEGIIDFTTEMWGSSQAVKYIDGLEEIGQMLADNPDAGLNRDELSSGLLSFTYQSHILYYLKNQFGITFIRVLHSNMDPVKQLN